MLDSDDVLEARSGAQLGGLPEKLTIYLVANQDFNSTEDIIS